MNHVPAQSCEKRVAFAFAVPIPPFHPAQGSNPSTMVVTENATLSDQLIFTLG